MILLANYGTIVRDKIITLEENKCKIVFFNIEKIPVQVIKVDRDLDFCGKRCDYFLLPSDKSIEHYVELKNLPRPKAIEQLENSIKHISLNIQSLKKCAYIVCKSISPKAQTRIQASRSKFNNDYSCSLIIGEKCLEADIKSCEEL